MVSTTSCGTDYVFFLSYGTMGRNDPTLYAHMNNKKKLKKRKCSYL
jgi:hypothetical protein